MTIASEITRIKTAIADAYTACQDMGATMPAVLNSDNLEQCIASISGGQPAKQGRFVAASAAKFAYSDDGLTWTEIENTSRCNRICYGDGKFVGVKSSSNNTAAYSSDGINWSVGTLPRTSSWTGVSYGNNKFVAVHSDNSSVIAYSSDGINWSSSNANRTGFYGVDFVNDKFIAVGNSYYYDYSTDGINWIQSTFPGGAKIWRKVVFGNGVYVALDNYNAESINDYAYSSDGLNWESKTLPVTQKWYSLAFGNGKFVMTGRGSITNQQVYAYSTDGINWIQSTFTWRNGSINRIFFVKDRFFIFDNDTSAYLYSTDGINWAQSTLPSSQSWFSIAYGEVQ